MNRSFLADAGLEEPAALATVRTMTQTKCQPGSSYLTALKAKRLSISRLAQQQANREIQ